MKTLTALFGALALGLLLASVTMAAPDSQLQQTPAINMLTANNGHSFRSLVTAQACKAQGAECNYAACPPTGRDDLLGNCKSDCCAGKCVFYPARPGATGYGPLCE